MHRCPTCDEELVCTDYYGRLAAHQDGVVIGDIYKCINEDCERHGDSWHVRRTDGELREGYPV